MTTIPGEIQELLIANWHQSRREKHFDPIPAVKLFLPWAPATWLVAEMNPVDRDRLFGLSIIAGEAELGDFSLSELATLSGPGNLRAEIDRHWRAQMTLSQYAARHRA